MSENITRSISGIIFIFLLVFSTLFSEYTLIAFFSLLALITVSEFCKLIQLKGIIPYLIASITIVLTLFFDFYNTCYDFVLCILTLFVSIQLLINLFKIDKKVLFNNDISGKYVQLFGYIIFPFILIMKLPYIAGVYSPQIVVSIFILIWTNDTFAYIFGKYLGKNKLFERVSPKKTIEGFIGGLFVSIIVSIILSYYFDFLSVTQFFATAIIMSVMGTIGDLIESRYKRIAEVKDSGKIMPGHGGILDRLDSVIFATPFLYFILYFIS